MQPSRHNARKKSNRVSNVPISHVSGANGQFLLLHFVDNYEEVVDQEDFISPINPTMTFSGNNVVIDYSLAYNHSEDSKKSIQSFFNSKNVVGQTLTLKDANYTNPIQQGNGDVFDAAGTYTINSFDEESGILVATKVTSNNLSDYISQYFSDYWIDNLRWTESSTTMTRVIEENSIVNRAGINSSNSFSNTLGEVLVGDILTIQFPDKKETSTFTVTGTRISDEGHEFISVDEPVPNDADGTTYFGSKIYITVSRREKSNQRSQRDPAVLVTPAPGYGACCVNEDGKGDADYCIDDVSRRTCNSSAGEEGTSRWHNGKTCEEIQCVPSDYTGACCYPDGMGPNNEWCAETSPSECASSMLGIYQGNNVSCEDAGCEPENDPDGPDLTPPEGACCLSGSCGPPGSDWPYANCVTMPEWQCNANEGTWYSDQRCEVGSQSSCCGTWHFYEEQDRSTQTTPTPTPTTNTTQTRNASPSYNVTVPRNATQTQARILAEEKWNETGRKTIRVRVVYRNGKRVYAFNGAGQNTESRPELMLEEGVVYRFSLTDRSLGLQGTHPLSFAASADGNISGSELSRYITRTNKKPGNRGAYIYFEVPASGREIYYYCKNHNGMGNVANVMLKRGSDEGPVIYPDVEPGVGPGGGGGVTGINECCDCDNCLMQAIMAVESCGGVSPCTDDDYQCNACKNDPQYLPNGDPDPAHPRPKCPPGPGGAAVGCGQYQIFPDFAKDARGLCPTPGIYQKGSPRVQACCNIPANAHDILCNRCAEGDSACCQQKKELSELIMACWKRKWSRNQGSGPCRCEGSGPGPVVDDEDCYTCEDLAKMHKEGRCGHQCCEKPNCCYQGSGADPSEGTDACNRAKTYWDKVKSAMCSIPGCASQCSDCANENPPSLEDQKRSERSMNTTTPRPRTVTTPQTTTPRPRTTTAPSYTPSTTQPPMSGGSMGGGGYSSGY